MLLLVVVLQLAACSGLLVAWCVLCFAPFADFWLQAVGCRLSLLLLLLLASSLLLLVLVLVLAQVVVVGFVVFPTAALPFRPQHLNAEPAAVIFEATVYACAPVSGFWGPQYHCELDGYNPSRDAFVVCRPRLVLPSVSVKKLDG